MTNRFPRWIFGLVAIGLLVLAPYIYLQPKGTPSRDAAQGVPVKRAQDPQSRRLRERSEVARGRLQRGLELVVRLGHAADPRTARPDAVLSRIKSRC